MSFRMYHPEVKATAECPSEEAYQQSWEHLGWLKLGEAEAYATDILGEPVTELGALSVDQLKRLIRYRGYELPSDAKKDSHVKAFQSTFSGKPQTAAAAVFEQPTSGFVAGANDPARQLAEDPDTSGLPSDPQHLTPEGNV